MSSIRLWNLRFDANVEEILERPGTFDVGGDQPQSLRKAGQEQKITLTPISIRADFGLETIPEEPGKHTDAWDDTRVIVTRIKLREERLQASLRSKRANKGTIIRIENEPPKGDQSSGRSNSGWYTWGS